MAQTVCPKCGFQQDEGEECRRCGIIFRRYQAQPARMQHPAGSGTPGPPVRKQAGGFRRFVRVLRWVSLAGLITALALILLPTAPPRIEITPEATTRAEAKVREFQSAARQGSAETLEMDSSELNGWLTSNLAIRPEARQMAAPAAPSGDAAIALAKRALTPTAAPDPSLEQVQSSVRDVKIELEGDSLRAHVAFELYGLNLSLELEGRLAVQNGYLRLEPRSGRLGSLPLLAGSLEGAARRLFDSPENREKFRLPPHIRDVRIEQGQLIVSTR